MKKKIILMGVFGLLLPFKIYAISGSLNLSCNSQSLNVNDTTNCTLSGYSSEEVSALSSSLSSSGNVEITNITTSSIWQGDGSGGSIDLYTDNNKSGSFAIASFTVKATGEGSGTINVGSTSFTDANFSESSIGGKSITINVKAQPKEVVDNNTNNSNNNSSTSNTNNNSGTSNTTNNSSTNNVQNQKPTDVEKKEENEKKDNDSSLKNLTIKGINFDFSSNNFEYNLEASNDIDTLDISAIKNSEKAKISIPDNLSLKDGLNTFTITVTAEDGTSSSYKLNVTRLTKVLSNNSYLKSLSIKNYVFDFNKDVFSYDLGTINVKELDVKAISEDENATVEIYGNKNINGKDAIVIKVTAENKDISEYILYVNGKNKCVNILFIIMLIMFLSSVGLNVWLFLKNNHKHEDEEVINIVDN